MHSLLDDEGTKMIHHHYHHHHNNNKLDLANARAVASAIKEWHSLRYPTASTVNILSYCLYTLFASGPGNLP
jgi:hypothetical protein